MTRPTDYSALFNQLLEVDGPFVTVPVARRALGKVLVGADTDVVDELRVAIEEYDADRAGLHGRWVRWVLSRVLGFEDDMAREGPSIAHLSHLVGRHGVTLRPALAVVNSDADTNRPVMLVTQWPPGVELTSPPGTDHWNASPIARTMQLCEGLDVALGLVTNGMAWTLVHVPPDPPASTATWDADLWLEERETLDAFVALCGAQRFFGVDEAETLAAMLADSVDSGEEVTNTLGRQVRAAVELLVTAFSDSNRDRRGELLADVEHRDVYRAAVTVMMRLVFLLSAEERRLLLLGDETYDAHYAISTLLDELESEVDPDLLFGRYDAWPRVLATFRLIHGGVQHDDRLQLPAYGGQLFDPERYPFLEGRQSGERFEAGAGDQRVLTAIDNGVMREILASLQRLRIDRYGEVRRLSFEHLDVEQIGTVYEGLLDYDCTVVSDTTLGVLAKRSRAKGDVEPEIALAELEAHAAEGRAVLERWLGDVHKFSTSQLRRLDYEPTDLELTRLLSACDNDRELADRVEPFLGIVRTDLRGLPVVFLPDSFVVTESTERASTGTYYTPPSIAAELVGHALDPLVHEPGPRTEPDPERWRLRPWEEIADLKVLDPACGSGAMLVAACRYLADRLVEAWDEQGVPTEVGLPLPGAEGAPLVVPADRELRTVEARRLVADRCLYGVDVQEMAVEMCKLSLWLTTLARGRPFSFLDHAIRHGDSLLGVTDLDEVEHLRLGRQPGQTTMGWSEGLHGQVKRALGKRLDLRGMPTVDAADVQEKARLHAEALKELETVTVVADALVGAVLSTTKGADTDRDTRLATLAGEVADVMGRTDPDERRMGLEDLRSLAGYWLDNRTPLHWPLVFPEVFLEGRGRFDATVANPPFLGGQGITGSLGRTYREHLVEQIAHGRRGSADLVAYFFLRGDDLATNLGYLATNTIAQGDTSEVGLAQIIDRGSTIYRAHSAVTWPGDASVEVAQVWITSDDWSAPVLLDGAEVDGIDEMLYRASPTGWRTERLADNADQSFQGSIVLGMGFTMTPEEAQELIARDPRNEEVLFPYMGGEDLNQSPTLTAPRWVINFFDWSEERARTYPDFFRILEEQVKPFRQERDPDGAFKRRPPLPQRYWHHAEKRPKLYRTIADLDRVLAICRVSKVVAPVFVPTGQILSEATVVFAYDDYFHFGVLTSGFHYRWTCRYASTMRTDIRYTPSDVFETFPQPSFSAEVEAAGRALDEHRSARMVAADEGLTDTYNRVHDPDDRTPEIVRLRELHIELDLAVRAAYGWDDLDLDHGFHPVRGQGTRFTFSPDAAVEVLYRLLELNRQRYEGEVAAGLHGKGAARLFAETP